MCFLFHLDLSLHANAGKKIVIMIFGTKHGARTKLVHDRMFPRYELIYYFFQKSERCERELFHGDKTSYHHM